MTLSAAASWRRQGLGVGWWEEGGSHDLQLHGLAIELDCPDLLFGVSASAWGSAHIIEDAYEVDTDCGDVGLGVCVVGESQQQARLSNTGVTDEEQLEEVVVSM